MRKLNRKNTIDDYLNTFRIYSPSTTIKKLNGTFNKSTINDYKKLISKQWFIDLIFDVENIYCPYCEREVLVKSIGLVRSSIDHFIPQSSDNTLAISFNNLIPSCNRCNGNKREKRISYSPNFCEFEQIKFHIQKNEDDFLEKIIISSEDQEMIEQIKILKLNDLYNEKNILSEINERYQNLKDLANNGYGDRLKNLTSFNKPYAKMFSFIFNDE